MEYLFAFILGSMVLIGAVIWVAITFIINPVWGIADAILFIAVAVIAVIVKIREIRNNRR